MATDKSISHNSLSGRDASDAHGIGAITGLKSSLATLKTDVNAALTYCYESSNARDVSVSHASIAVAEAAQVASMAKKFQSLSAELASTEERVTDLVNEVEVRTLLMATTAAEVEDHRAAAEKAAATAVQASAGVQEVATQLDVVQALAAQVNAQVSYVSTAAESARTSAASAELSASTAQAAAESVDVAASIIASTADAVQKNMELSQASAESAVNASNAALAAQEAAAVSANTAKGYRDETQRVASELEGTIEAARELEKVLIPAVDSIEQNLVLSQQAASSAEQYAQLSVSTYDKVSAAVTDARQAAAEADKHATQASLSASSVADGVEQAQSYAKNASAYASAASAAKETAETAAKSAAQDAASSSSSASTAQAAADIAVEAAGRASDAVTGALHMRGTVSSLEELPSSPAQYDAYLVRDSLYFWDGDQWIAFVGSSYQSRALLGATADEVEAMTTDVNDGVIISVITTI